MSYTTTHEHLRAELDRIEAIIEAHRVDDSPTDSGEPATTERDEPPDPSAVSLAVADEDRETIREHAETIRQQCRDSENRLRLRVLADVCGLSRRHLDVLMLAMAPVLNRENEARFQRGNDDRSLSQPTPRYVETLFGRTPGERLAAGRLINRNSPLRKHDLIELRASSNGRGGHANRRIVPSERVVAYLSGDDSIDPELAERLAAAAHGDGIADCEANTAVDDLAVSDEISQRVSTLAAEEATRCYLHGPASEKQRAVEAVVAGQYLTADLRAVLRADTLEWLCREAALLGRGLHLYNGTAAVDDPETTSSLGAVFEACDELQTDLLITGRESWMPTETLPTELDAIIEFPYPSVELRQAFWDAHTAELPDELAVDVLAGTFRLTHEQHRAALSTARTLADGELTVENVYAGCRAQSRDDLQELADRIEPDNSWDEIRLSSETERKLHFVQTHITQQARIYTDWGFEERFSHGTGVVALFEGPSGTGKTMAAEILAGEVGMDLYRIDLSSVVSKYIGETEEKLEAIFEAATNANAILLFDEADAVFGDRTDVSDSTDRYANAEVNYLLQRIEHYDGVVLLTTNYASQIDSAFERRLDHTVSFKRPQQDTRSAIWHDMFPDQAPLGEIDYEFLSDFEFTGGQIKTITQRAAILAARDGGENTSQIEMQHLVEAIQLAVEQKGLMVDPAEYAPYAHYLYDGEEPSTNVADTETPVDATEPENEPLNREEQAGEKSCGEKQDDEITDETDQAVDEPESLRPESVVRTFYDRFDRGDPSVYELYHSNAIVEQVSMKQLRRAQHTDDPELQDLQRVQDETSRVRIECLRKQEKKSKTIPISIELRLDDDDWRVFSVEDSQRRHRRSQ